MSTILASIRLEFRDAVFARMEKVNDLRGLRESANATTNAFGSRFAESYKDLMKDVISKKPRTKFQGNPVGASGTASENIELRFNDRSFGYKVWEVIEGSKTDANALMRAGLPPKTNPKISTLRAWAANKNIRFWTGDKKDRRAPIFQKSSRGKTYARSFPKTKDEATTFLWKVVKMLNKYGSNRGDNVAGEMSPHNWYVRYPKGKGFYNYPRYVLTLADPDKTLATFNQAMLVAIVDTILTGRKQDVKGKQFFGVGRS